MPYIAQDIIEGKQKPVTVLLNDSAQKALELMVENNFTQLPVVDANYKPIGLVTGDSILRAVANLNIPLDKLKIAHVLERVDSYPKDFAIFDLLDSLNIHSAVLIIDSDNKLVGIITNWDTADYFRKRAIDTMLLEDVEDLLKEHILAAFNHHNPQNADILLDNAINEIANTGEKISKDIRGALNKYMNLAKLDHKPNDEFIHEAFNKVIGKTNTKKTLEDLNLYEFTELLLYKLTWDTYNSHLDIPTESLRQLLNQIRESRNSLAHFKREISEWERQRIKYCIFLLQEIHPVPVITPENSATSVSLPPLSTRDNLMLIVDEKSKDNDSMYAPLAIHLQNQPNDQPNEVNQVQRTFEEIEIILGNKLPNSARDHRSWWANDSVSHTQSQQWLRAGWRVTGVNMNDGIITFSRNKERESEYIHFFNALLSDLRDKAPLVVGDFSPTGKHYAIVKQLLRNNRDFVQLRVSFTLQQQFRVELYINSDSEARNKAIFEKLHQQKQQIEADFGEELIWESFNSRTDCRIASYRTESIIDDGGTQVEIKEWAINKIIRLEKAIAERAIQSIPK